MAVMKKIGENTKRASVSSGDLKEWLTLLQFHKHVRKRRNKLH